MTLLVFWPALMLPAKVFNYQFFYFWLIVITAWSVAALLVMLFFPLYEYRKSICEIVGNILRCRIYLTPYDREK